MSGLLFLWKSLILKHHTICGEIFDTAREHKIHVHTHSYTSESKVFKCKNCDFETKSVYTMEVHVTKCRNENFECGLCEEIFVEEKDLDTHLRTCETYECSNCWKRIKHLSDMKKHWIELTEKVNLTSRLIHTICGSEKKFNSIYIFYICEWCKKERSLDKTIHVFGLIHVTSVTKM